jgi:hypothetical protein
MIVLPNFLKIGSEIELEIISSLRLLPSAKGNPVNRVSIWLYASSSHRKKENIWFMHIMIVKAYFNV